MTTQNKISQPKKDEESPAAGAATLTEVEDDEGLNPSAGSEEANSPLTDPGRSLAPRRRRDSERELRKLCVDAAPAATRRLINIALDPLTPDQVAIAQCKEILERAYGRTRDLQPFEEPEIESFDFTKLTFPEAMELERLLLKSMPEETTEKKSDVRH